MLFHDLLVKLAYKHCPRILTLRIRPKPSLISPRDEQIAYPERTKDTLYDYIDLAVTQGVVADEAFRRRVSVY